MKRSELVEIVHEYLWENYPDIDAADIVTIIEQSGMLPPIHYPFSCYCSMRGSCPSCNPNEYKMYNTWEPEDETK